MEIYETQPERTDLPLVVNLIGAVVIILAWTMTFLWLYRGMFPDRKSVV